MQLRRRTGIMWGTQICSFLCAVSDGAVGADAAAALGWRTSRAQGLGAVSSTMGNSSLLPCFSFINCTPCSLKIFKLSLPSTKITARGSQQHFCAVELFLATQPSFFLFFFPSFAYDHLICMRMTFVAPVISSDNGQLAKRIWKHIP